MGKMMMVVSKEDLKELFLDFLNDVEPDKPLDVEAAAEKLGFSTKKLVKEAESGVIPGRKIGSQWRFSDKGLNRWLENREE